MNYFRSKVHRVGALLELATARHLLEWQPILGVVVLSTLTHLSTGLDTGTASLLQRAPLAVIATLPAFPLVLAAHWLSKGIRSRVLLVSLAYILAGLIRGVVLDVGLGLISNEVAMESRWRIPASGFIMFVTLSAVGYMWSTLQRVRLAIQALNSEQEALTEAFAALQEVPKATGVPVTDDLVDRIFTEVRQIANADDAERSAELSRIVNQVVRPLSVEFARDISRWTPQPAPAFEVTFREVWRKIDPAKHLPSPSVAVIGILLASFSSLITFFDQETALRTALAFTFSLLLSLIVGYRIVQKLLLGVRPPWRDLLITLALTLMAIAPAASVQWNIAGTPHPDAYVTQIFLSIIVFGWVLIVGNSALDLAREVSQAVQRTRQDLKWSSARINLLDWYHHGVISRLLHGPVQNSIQVGMLRIGAADDHEHPRIVNEVLTRIEQAVSDVLDAPNHAKASLSVLSDLVTTWQGVADLELTKTPQFLAAALQDPAAATIVVDVAAEACSNAIRHGKARRLSIHCDAVNQVIVVDIVDDGAAHDFKSNASGLGVKFLEACSVEFSRQSSEDGNQLEILIPWSASTEAPAAPTTL